MAKPRKVIITCAVTGSIHTPSMSPHLPVTAQQIADAAIGAAEAGAAVVHLHARNPQDGRPDQTPEAFAPVPQGDQAALERGGEHHHRRRADHDGRRSASSPAATFKPEVASLNMGTMNFGLYPMIPRYKGKFKHDWEEPYLEGSRKGMFKNTFADIEYILTTCAENNTRFEIECYDIGHLYTLRHFLDRGVVKPPLFVQSVFGILGGIGTHPEDVIMMKRTADRLLGDNYHWSVLGAGANQMRVAAQAAAMGGNVRVGMEDSLWIGPASSPSPTPSRSPTCARSSKVSAWRSPARTRRAKSSRSRAATRWRSSSTRSALVQPRIAQQRVSDRCDDFSLRCAANPSNRGRRFARMASLDSVSITILLGAVLVLAGILSSLIALRFGAPLLLVFLLVGMLAGEAGPGGIKFDDVRHDLYRRLDRARPDPVRRRPAHAASRPSATCWRPPALLATVGVLITTALTAPVARSGRSASNWIEALLVGAVVASTDAAAVFFLLNAKRLAAAPARPRDAGGRIRHQRSVRDLSHHRCWSRSCWSATRAGSTSLAICWPRKRSSAASSAGRRPRHRAGAQPAGAAAGPACAVRRDQRAGRVRLRQCGARLGLSRGLSRRPGGRQPRRRARIIPSSCFSMP